MNIDCYIVLIVDTACKTGNMVIRRPFNLPLFSFCLTCHLQLILVNSLTTKKHTTKFSFAIFKKC